MPPAAPSPEQGDPPRVPPGRMLLDGRLRQYDVVKPSTAPAPADAPPADDNAAAPTTDDGDVAVRSTGGCLTYRSAAAAKWGTVAALTATFIIEKADEAILPSTYGFIGKALGATPAQLGNISLARALAQAATAPIAGVLGDRLDRPRIVSFAAISWGVMTVAMGLMTSVSQAVAFSVVNGIGLSLLIPSVQSIIADYYDAGARGRAFGTLYLVSSLGSMAGGFFATTVGGKQVGGLAGWRFAFLLIAAASVVVGLAVLLFAADPRAAAKRAAARSRTDKSLKATAAWVRARLGGMARDVRLVLAIPTFRIIVAQGIVGSMPWTAMGFWTVYLQLLGFPDAQAAAIVAAFSLGCAAGSYIGGAVGDFAHKRAPAWGRVASCQACVAASLPLAYLMTKALPQPTILGGGAATVAAVPKWMVPAWAAAFAGAGSLMSWCGTSNSAIFAEVVPECLRSSIYAFDRSFETAIGALAGPIVGVLASKVFGFKGALAVDKNAPPDLIAHNARALGTAILTMMVTPWAFCLLFYTGLYWYLPRDRIKAAALAERLAAEEAAARLEGAGKGGAVVVADEDDDVPSSSSSGDFGPAPPGKTVA